MADGNPYRDSAGQTAMGNLFGALKMLQESNQGNAENKLKAYLQQRELGSRAELQKESEEAQMAETNQKFQNQQAAQQKSIDEVKSFMPTDKNGNPQVPTGAGFSVTPEGASFSKGMNNLAAYLGMDRFYDKQAETMSDKAQKEGIPALQAQTDAVKNDMAQHGGHLQSVGGWKNMIPDWAAGAAESMHVLPPGSAMERQHLAAVRNAAMHAQFGSRQTEAEKSMMADQLGLHSGVPAENIEQGISGLENVANREAQNLTSGMNPQSVQRFKARGGNIGVSPLTQQPQQQQAPTQPVDPIEAELRKRGVLK